MRGVKKTLDDMPENWREILLKLAMEGYAEVEMRAHLLTLGGHFSQPVWDAMKRREPELKEFFQQTIVLSEAWWIKTARTNLQGGYFQTGLWYSCMKNMFNWKEKKEVEHLGEGVAAQKIMVVYPPGRKPKKDSGVKNKKLKNKPNKDPKLSSRQRLIADQKAQKLGV